MILTDGRKAVNLLDSNDPRIWTFFSGAPASSRETLYGYVAAAFRAFNLKANTVGAMPFILYGANGDEVDATDRWENVAGVLPNPSELLRLDTLSYMDSNCIYNLKTSDVLGRKIKGVYHAVASNFSPVTDPVTGELLYIVRKVGTGEERYEVDDPRLVRMWRLDHTTEVLPSKYTEAQAIENAAAEVFYTDTWIKHYYEGGGIRPTLIAMKGAVKQDIREEEESKWTQWLRGLGRYVSNRARVFNAETLEVKAFGDGVADLKDNRVYEQALANIAMGTGMPLSLLLANSANYATAEAEKKTWYDNDIIPLCNWLEYEYNRQLWEPLGYYMQFHPETLDPQQEDETQRASALGALMDALLKTPTFELFIGASGTLGYELTDEFIEAAKQYYSDKKQNAITVQEQMNQTEEPEEETEDEPEEDTVEPEEQKFVPSLEQLRELDLWQSIAYRKLKRGEPLDFPWENKSLPDELYQEIGARLVLASDEAGIKAAFEMELPVSRPADDGLLELAKALNRAADVEIEKMRAGAQDIGGAGRKATAQTPMVFNLTANMPQPGEPAITINIPEQPAPVVNVEPTPVTINNEVKVRPAPVTIADPGRRKAHVRRDKDGKIIEITSDSES